MTVWNEKSLASRKKRLAIFNIQNDQSFTIHVSGELHDVNAVTKARQKIKVLTILIQGKKIPRRLFFFPSLDHFRLAQHTFYNS